MKPLAILTILLGSVGLAQNGGVVSPPDIVGSAARIAEAPNTARESAAQTQLVKLQTALRKAQREALKQRNGQAAAAKGVIAASGNEFLRKCGNPDNAPVECIAYIGGVTDGLER